MRAFVIYDSLHGNTERIAQAIGEALGGDVSVRRAAGNEGAPDVSAGDLLIVGSPTHGGWFTEAIKGWLDGLPATALQGVHVAAFDTRTSPSVVSRIFRWAGPRIANRLEKKGGTLLVPPAAFIVEGVKGPLKAGEPERAAEWAREIRSRLE